MKHENEYSNRPVYVLMNFRPYQPKASTKATPETLKKKKEDEADDNWDDFDVKLPY